VTHGNREFTMPTKKIFTVRLHCKPVRTITEPLPNIFGNLPNIFGNLPYIRVFLMKKNFGGWCVSWTTIKDDNNNCFGHQIDVRVAETEIYMYYWAGSTVAIEGDPTHLWPDFYFFELCHWNLHHSIIFGDQKKNWQKKIFYYINRLGMK